MENFAKGLRLEWGKNHKELGYVHMDTRSCDRCCAHASLCIGFRFWHDCFDHKSEALREKYDWFLARNTEYDNPTPHLFKHKSPQQVVRNPFSRMISEFHCTFGGVGSRAKYVNISFISNVVALLTLPDLITGV